MDFHQRVIEANSQIANALSNLHSLNLFTAKKQFISSAKKLLVLANESKRDKVLYDKFMNMVIFSLSSSGYERKELEKNFGSMIPHKFLKSVTCEDQFSDKKEKLGRNDFHQELDLIFTYAPFVTKSESSERIRVLFKKFDMPYPLSQITSLCKI